MAAWRPHWAVLQAGVETKAPPYLGGEPQVPTWWFGARELFSPLVQQACVVYKASPVARITFEQWWSGSGLPPHPSQPHLHTQCLVVGKCSEWLASEQGQPFRLQPDGPASQGPSRGYMKALPDCAPLFNTTEFYLHHLLCWVYRGPCPPDRWGWHLCGGPPVPPQAVHAALAPGLDAAGPHRAAGLGPKEAEVGAAVTTRSFYREISLAFEHPPVPLTHLSAPPHM